MPELSDEQVDQFIKDHPNDTFREIGDLLAEIWNLPDDLVLDD